MNASELIGEVTDLVNRNRELEDKLSKTVSLDKFYNAALTTEMVGVLHGVSAGIVRRYVEYGLIELHPMSTDGKWLIRGSVALSLDFDDLRKKAKFKRSCSKFI